MNGPESGVNLISADVSLFLSSFRGLKENLTHVPGLELGVSFCSPTGRQKAGIHAVHSRFPGTVSPLPALMVPTMLLSLRPSPLGVWEPRISAVLKLGPGGCPWLKGDAQGVCLGGFIKQIKQASSTFLQPRESWKWCVQRLWSETR